MVKMLHKKSGSVLGKATIRASIVPGFSLLQIALAIAVIGIVVAAALPNFVEQMPGYTRKAFVTQLNAFMGEVWQQGLQSRKLQKIVFDLNNREVFLEQYSKDDDAGEPVFSRVVIPYTKTAVIWPETLHIRQLFIQGFDEFNSQANQRKTDKIWFFMVPDGMSQEVIVNMLSLKDNQSDDQGKQIGLVLNPFTNQFKVYDEFQSPA